MKKFKNLFRILFFLAFISAVSCEKIIDFLPGKTKDCRIKRIHFIDRGLDYYGDFYYNRFGNPDSVKFGVVDEALPNLYFKYNNKNQLRQILFQVRSGSGLVLWFKLGYTKNLITTDTVYVWSSEEEPEPLHYFDKYIMHIEYDNFGRVIKESWVPIAHPEYLPNVLVYSYDTNGNKITYDTLSYDNNKNIHTLHPIWQFLDRDYSLNNPIPATSYNNFRLPLTFDQSRPPGSFARYHFMYRSLEKATIEYDCK